MKQTNKGRVIDITIPIKPVPKARPRFSSAGHQVFTPSKTHAAENTIAVLVLNKMKLSGMQMIATGPVKVTAEFFFKTAEKRKHETAKSSRPDVDNLGKPYWMRSMESHLKTMGKFQSSIALNGMQNRIVLGS